ncbi:hypothetical protein HDU87_002464 [Geranomyces variabilis]|uniref:AB hydrolase-1 domain-containing protein n=1 Tax=Geranomyces variabilis TaxID=109894 RepID=A0AAD5TL65_9FUNG|nr:hypothetical protein HDU87_002464 [Geranomyces variabilis]
MIPRILEVGSSGTSTATSSSSTVTGPASIVVVASPTASRKDYVPRKVHTVNAASPTGPRKHLRPIDPEKRLSLPVETLMSPAASSSSPSLLLPSNASSCAGSSGLSASAATQAVKKAAGSISRATIAGAKKIKTDTDTHLAIAAETAMNFFPGAAVRTNTSPQLQVSQQHPAESEASRAAAASAAASAGRRDSCRSSQRSRVTADGTCTLFVEDYKVPLSDGSGFLPMDRECRRETFSKGSQKGAVLLIPGFASNRQMFHLGGGVGKSGPSFSEFLAQREYDVFAIDLRGTTESLALGGKRAAGMREYVEVDIPSAIQMIKRLGGYKQVYLIGHSMGGALSCAVAGICPEDVAGVIHLAGLYHYTLPGLSEVIDLYKAFCPRPIKAVVRTSSSIAARSASAVLSPVISGVGYVLGVNSSSAAPTTPAAARRPSTSVISISETAGSSSTDNDAQQQRRSLITAEPSRPPILHYTHQFITHLKRQPIPLKTGLNVLLFLRQFVPERIEKALMNAWYPSPWVANSVEDPWGLMKASVESPSVGVYLSIAQMALHHEFYNNWVANSSVHRAEVASDGSDGKPSGAATNETSKSASSTVNLLVPPALNARSLSSTSSTSDSSTTTAVSDPPPTPNIAGLRKKRVPKAPPHHPDLTDEETWNELTTYLRKFESLEQLPLFFCYANADGVIRMKDSLVGYERSGSFWKDVIHYEDEVLEDPATIAAKAEAAGASPAAAAQASEDLADDILRDKIVDGVKESFEDCCKVLRTGCDNVGVRTPSISTATTPAAAAEGGDVDANNSTTLAADRKVHFSPAYDESDPASAILWASSRPPKKSMSSTALHALHRGPHHQHHHHHHTHHVRPPPPMTKINTTAKTRAGGASSLPSASQTASSPAAATAAAANTPSGARGSAATSTAGASASPQTPTFKPQFPAVFSLDAGTSYGHIDVLGGVHAEVLWVCIAEWLEKTSARNRTWGFWRRYSAK